MSQDQGQGQTGEKPLLCTGLCPFRGPSFDGTHYYCSRGQWWTNLPEGHDCIAGGKSDKGQMILI
jgi:hypothetical protein